MILRLLTPDRKLIGMFITTMTSVPERYWFVGELDMKTRNHLMRDTVRSTSMRLRYQQNGMLFYERSTAYRLFASLHSERVNSEVKEAIDETLREFFKYEEVSALENNFIHESRDPYWFLLREFKPEWQALEAHYLWRFRSDIACVLSTHIANMEWILSNELTARLKNELAKIRHEASIVEKRLALYREIPLANRSV